MDDRKSTVRAYKVTKLYRRYLFRVHGGPLEEVNGRFADKVHWVAWPRYLDEEACESVMEGSSFDLQTIDKAVSALSEDFSPIDDLRASATYRQRVAGNLLRRAFLAETHPGSELRVTEYV